MIIRRTTAWKYAAAAIVSSRRFLPSLCDRIQGPVESKARCLPAGGRVAIVAG
jgi:hypothetical protein